MANSAGTTIAWDGFVPTLIDGAQHLCFSPPLVLLWWDGERETQFIAEYSAVNDGIGEGTITTTDDVQVHFRDVWNVGAGAVHLDRTVTVVHGGSGSFATRIGLDCGPGDWTDVQLFLPGTQYGDPAHANRSAIAGRDAREQGDTGFTIREDRLTAPLLALRMADGSTVTMLDEVPDGRTVLADATDHEVTTVVDAGVRLGALGLDGHDGRLRLTYTYPAVEGHVTYRGNTFPDGQVREWRRRYHPAQDGSTQRYELAWRTGRAAGVPELIHSAWRWAWSVLSPRVEPNDIATARIDLADQLAGSASVNDLRAGFPHFLDATTGRPYEPRHRQDTHAFMGFTGRSTDCAYYLLREAAHSGAARSARYVDVATRVLDSFAAMPYDPPEGEGFDIETGDIVPAAHQARDDVMLLRGLAEGAKSMIRAERFERANGREHLAWRRWGMGLAAWLLRQQRADGSLPRAWRLGSEEVVDPSGYSTFNAIGLFVEAYQAEGDAAYLRAARAAGGFCWDAGQCHGVFVGGTLDNPDVIDKEAGTLSLEGYLALHDATGDAIWIERARAAADFAETWVYVWDVPATDDDSPDQEARGRGWKRGVSTVGAQLIASGHSLVDQYMAFDVANYAKLFALTGDSHYREVAAILLHNTKSMLAVGERTWDLAGRGWQQEHWSFAPVRGEGLHRGWLPWVTCSHLEGLVQLEDFDPALYRELSLIRG